MSLATLLMRFILILLSGVSFIPQYRHILRRGNCSGISLYYLLFNLITATEQFALDLHVIVNAAEVYDTIIANPPTLGDWLNFGQFAVVWVGHLVWFVQCLTMSPQRPRTKSAFVAVYTAFFLVSVAPVLFEASLPHPIGSPGPDDRKWFPMFFAGVHTMYVNPLVTILSLLSLYAQARQTPPRPRLSEEALSPVGLAVQAIVFTVLALYWPFRLTLPPEFRGMPILRSLLAWYQLVGWAAVDSAVFAFVQAALLLMGAIARRNVPGGELAENDETTPLLQ